jgi:hypothetical protein
MFKGPFLLIFVEYFFIAVALALPFLTKIEDHTASKASRPNPHVDPTHSRLEP